MSDINMLVSEGLQEILYEGEYHELFRSKLKEFGVASPAHLSKEWKGHFFRHVKKEWAAHKKRKAKQTAKTS